MGPPVQIEEPALEKPISLRATTSGHASPAFRQLSVAPRRSGRSGTDKAPLDEDHGQDRFTSRRASPPGIRAEDLTTGRQSVPRESVSQGGRKPRRFFRNRSIALSRPAPSQTFRGSAMPSPISSPSFMKRDLIRALRSCARKCRMACLNCLPFPVSRR